MGNTQSDRQHTKAVKRPLTKLYNIDLENSFVVVGCKKVESLDFNPAETFVVSYGIDKQTNPRFSKKTLSSVTVLDAHQVCMALIDTGIALKDHVQLFGASKDLDVCTIQGMKESFQAAANRVSKEGMFFFHFSGHGIKVGNEWGLAPADFDYTRATFVSGDVLNSWLNEVKCKARYVIISLDCCYAGGLANELTASAINLRSGTYVLSACTAFETSLVIGPLGHSVFAYFLSYALRTIPFSPGSLPIHKIFTECSTLCMCLSSFLVSYSPEFGLKSNTMEPQLQYFDIASLGSKSSLRPATIISEDNRLSLMSINRYSFVTQYFGKYNTGDSELCSLSLDWLGSMTEDRSLLRQLKTRGLLRDEILRAIVCCMMWSFASIQFIENIANVNKTSHFLLAFLYTAYALDSEYKVQLTHEHMVESIEFYLGVVEANSIDSLELLKFKDEMIRNTDKEKETLTDQENTSTFVSDCMEVDVLESIKVSVLVTLITLSAVQSDFPIFQW